MKKIILLIAFFSLASCSDLNNDCENNNFYDFSKLDYEAILNTCNYMEKLKNNIYAFETLYIPSFYELSRIDTGLWKSFLDYLKINELDLNLWEVDKIKMYYILKNLYWYDDYFIENDMWIKIDEKYKNYNFALHRLILWENLLIWWDYEEWFWSYYEIIGEKYILDKELKITGFIMNEEWKITNYVTNDEIRYLKDMIELDVSVYDEIVVASADEQIIDSLDNEGKELYNELLQIVLNNTKNQTTIYFVNQYMKKFN